MSAEEFQRIRLYTPRSRSIDELTDEELIMISKARVGAEHEHLNAPLDD